MKEENLCVLIDFENIAAGTEKAKLGRFDIGLVMNRLKEKGRILVTRAYGDWGRFAKFKQSLLEQGVSMMELTSYRGQDKNRADIALVVDAMELAYTREYISTFVLLSGDSDFTPLAMRLKELNKRVIGLGTKGSTSRLLTESCDEFIFYENLLRRSPPTTPIISEEEPTIPLKKEEAVQILMQTMEGIQKDQPGPMSAGFLKQSIMRKYPTFDEGEFGFSGFTAFLKDSQKSKKITLLKDPRSAGYQVDLYQSEIDDAQLPEIPDISIEARGLWDKLIGININPTTHMIRHTVVHELVDHVSERMAKKKRNSLRYVFSDIQRRCRKTDPPITATDVRYVIESIQAAGLLLHPNGDPVRSENAQFIIKHEAEALLLQLREYYIQQLLNTGSPLNNYIALSELLWGDSAHVEEAQEIVMILKQEEAEIRSSVFIQHAIPAQNKDSFTEFVAVSAKEEGSRPSSPKGESMATSTVEPVQPNKEDRSPKTTEQQTEEKKKTKRKRTSATKKSSSAEGSSEKKNDNQDTNTETKEFTAKKTPKKRTAKKSSSTRNNTTASSKVSEPPAE